MDFLANRGNTIRNKSQTLNVSFPTDFLTPSFKLKILNPLRLIGIFFSFVKK